MKRILVIGCCGAGKTMAALELGRKFSLPVYHLDKLWWLSGWRENTPEKFDAELAEILRLDSWIIDGNYARTLPERLKYADTVIFLKYSRILCLWRVFKRFLQYRGRSRADIADGCPERLNVEFLRYVWTFNRDMLPRIQRALEQHPGVRVLTFSSPSKLRVFLAEAKEAGETLSADR